MKTFIGRLIREPLFHFLLLGASIFFLAGRVRNASIGAGEKIVVTQSEMESMVVGFSRTWMRPPTQGEMQGLVDDYVREEVLYREARAMGLDQDDVIVRRRMRQKFEFLAEDLATDRSPTDQELEAYLQQHLDRFREEPSFSFEHIFLSREKHGASTEAEVKVLLAELGGKNEDTIDIEKRGDTFLLPSRFEKTSAAETARLFGENFATRLAAIEPGEWAGPIESSYGLHLVRVDARVPGTAPPLANVRDSVLRDFLDDRRKQELDAQYSKLRARYTVVVEPPEVRKVAEAR
jgi:PPIC-type PPIASE domain